MCTAAHVMRVFLDLTAHDWRCLVAYNDSALLCGRLYLKTGCGASRCTDSYWLGVLSASSMSVTSRLQQDHAAVLTTLTVPRTCVPVRVSHVWIVPIHAVN
jgi:hypothetical protein